MTMRPFTDHQGGLNHLVDAQIGRAFPVVHKVYQHLDTIEYVAHVYKSGRSRDIVIRTNHTKEWIEWQYKGETKWTILFKFSDLLGANIADVVAAEQAIAAELVQLRQQLTVSMEDVNEARDAASASHAGAETARLAAEAARDAASVSQTAAAQSATTAATLVQDMGTTVADAQASATSAANSRLAAEVAQTSAATSATAAATSQNAAQGAATDAIAAKNTAALSKTAAEQAAQAAAQSETSAGNFAGNAAASASAAALSATTAANHAGVVESVKTATESAAAEGAQHLAAIQSQVATAEQLRTQTEAASQVGLTAQAAAETAAATAGTHAENAEEAAAAAEQSASSADAHRVSAQVHASNAAVSATVATTKAEEITTAASTAVVAAAQADSASVAAANSASIASMQASEAALSAASAATSASTAVTKTAEATTAADSAAISASTATAKATEATTAASTAITKADEAASAASSALASASSAAASYDSFDDRYLGTKSSDPATDNDGQPLLEGALYWNTVGKNMRVWDGTKWYVAQFTDAPNDGRAYIRRAGTWVENFSGVGSAVSAETLATARAINGTPFDGSADITTSQWGTARDVTIGATTKSVDGSVNVDWTLPEIGAEPALAAGTAGQYYRGDKTWQPLNSAAVGLGNVDDTSDANKPISTAVASALATKVDVVAGKQLSTEDFSSEEKTKLAGIAAGANAYVHPASHPPSIIAQDANNRFVTDTEKSVWGSKAAGTHVHSKADVGLSNVDNTSDANKPVSTAQASAISASTATNIHAATSKETPIDADELGVSDSAASWSLKKLTWANLKAALQGVFMPRSSFGGNVDKTRQMADAQVGSVDAFVTLDGAGPDWPAQSLSTAWWNVFTYGVWARRSQIAQQAFHTRIAQFWFRNLHNTTWSPWYRVPTTTAETGFLVQDGGVLGYGVGSGGTVTQATSKTTPVTLNKACGRITMNNASLAAGAAVEFSLNNTLLTDMDGLIVNPDGFTGYAVEVAYFNSPTEVVLRVTNKGATRSDALVIKFRIFKGELA